MTITEQIVSIIRETPGINYAALHDRISSARGRMSREYLDNELAKAKRAGLVEYRRAERGWFVVEEKWESER